MLAHLARHAGRSVAGCWRVRVGFVAHWAGLLLLLVLIVGGGSEQRRGHDVRAFSAGLQTEESQSAAGLQPKGSQPISGSDTLGFEIMSCI